MVICSPHLTEYFGILPSAEFFYLFNYAKFNVSRGTVLSNATHHREPSPCVILPNGIVVLMVSDVEAYMDGTLQFYNNNDQTLTE